MIKILNNINTQLFSLHDPGAAIVVANAGSPEVNGKYREVKGYRWVMTNEHQPEVLSLNPPRALPVSKLGVLWECSCFSDCLGKQKINVLTH